MFLSKLLPSEGLYCVAMALPAGGFRHFFFADLAQAERRIDALNVSGHTVYIAQATFNTVAITEAQAHNATLPPGSSKSDRAKERTQKNAHLLKNFFLDIDCGEKWPLKNQKEGIVALKKFIADTGLPFPAVVNSGNGLYAHWILEQAIPADKWQSVAYILKQVVAKYSPEIGGDASRTSDSASVLRPPGTTNRKPGRPEKLVSILKDAEPVPFLDFVAALNTAARARFGEPINTAALLAPKTVADLNADFFAGLEYKSDPSDAGLIAEKCGQLRELRDKKGAGFSEPVWYACLGVLAFCQNAAATIHEWASGSAHYNPNSSYVDEKIAHFYSSGVGPTTCARLGELNSTGCIGCKHNNKIKSPIVLGRPEPEAIVLPDEQCVAPDGFRRGDGGLYADEDGRWVKFYDQDLYIERLAYDESLGYEVMTIRHTLPHEGKMECTVRSSLVNDPKALVTILSDNHIKAVGTKEKKYMVNYLESYAAKLQRQRKMSMLLCQMGWKESKNGTPMFVLGEKVFHSDGRVEEASLAKNVPVAAKGFRSSGELDKWVAATEILGVPGMEPFAFALLCGFGAPLMKFTGFDGAMVSLVGESGAGKTLMLRFIQSIWGYHNDLMMLRDDTKNALVSRLGVYGNLPLTIDEITNIDNMELSDLVYRVTQGRDKARLTKDAQERKVLNSWNTLAVTSSNSSLIDKLSGAKHDASAEINRVFEYPVIGRHCFKDQVTKRVYWAIHENYGVAGPVYLQWLVQNLDKVPAGLEAVRVRIDEATVIQGDERFWSAVASCAIYGGLVAQKLGLLKFSIAPVMTWAQDTIFNMRGAKNDLAGDSVGILGQFIDEHAPNRLLVSGTSKGPAGCTVVEPPRGQLHMRYELDFNRLYISRNEFKRWITMRFGSYTTIKNELMAAKVLINPNKRKSLGGGTFYGGTQQVCWEIDLGNKAISWHVQNLIEVSELLAKHPPEQVGGI